ncbi:hypothetical protein HHK36_026707 [Tetracentron sinense]|uniref:mitogen-activated protein kinase kinase kinase n=1 Tax=Tetracentron sinense TaxID=13715 RepID=A0A834YLV6_TETSI|nr:hypothetical protein HHK36_026707 [Tetracentron sinense]
MQYIFGSVRRSLVFRNSDGDEGGVGGMVEKIGSCIRKSRVGLFSRPLPPALPPIVKDNAPPIRWRKGELIGCGAFGRVYMGMNLDSGELLAVKQAHIRELEEEVKLLKNLSRPNIVRYLGTTREEGTLNILLEFVPGGSISALLGKFGSFPEAVIRMYTKQLLLGLEYLHKNLIMHRDIKGANNKGCIKLADFGALKQVVELATISGAKSVKGTPYWMAPEVILQTGHSFSADIWSVGCTVIEMATGKPPWSQQYQEVAALFHIGMTKSYPPIPEHLSVEAKDFLLKCLQKEPNLRPAASELLQHPFVTGEYREPHPVFHASVVGNSGTLLLTSGTILKNSPKSTCNGLKDMGSVRCSTIYPEKFSETRSYWGTSNREDDMCQIDDKDDFVVGGSVKFKSALTSDDFNKSFNPMCEPSDDWPCKLDESSELEQSRMKLASGQPVDRAAGSPGASVTVNNDFTFPFGPSAIDLKKLQTPLYEEFYNTLNVTGPPSVVRNSHTENVTNYLKLPPKSRSPSRLANGSPSAAVDNVNISSPGSCSRRVSNIGSVNSHILREIPSPQLNEWKGILVDAEQELASPSAGFSERQRMWKEELERKREIMSQTGIGGKTSSLKDRALNRQREQSRFASQVK